MTARIKVEAPGVYLPPFLMNVASVPQVGDSFDIGGTRWASFLPAGQYTVTSVEDDPHLPPLVTIKPQN